MDRKPVNLLTTTANPLDLSTCTRYRRQRGPDKRGRHHTLSCPQVLDTYTQHMRAVDVYSQRESYARIGRKINRWWAPLAWFMIDAAINSAYVLYTLRADGRKQSATEFRKELMEALVNGFTQRKKRGRPQKQPVRADAPHIPMRLETEATCAVCAKKRKRKSGEHKPRTREGCETCECAVHFECWKKHLKIEVEEDG